MNERKKEKKILNLIKKKLEIDKINKSDPKIVNEILSEMELNEFKSSFNPFNEYISKLKTEPVRIKKFLNNIEVAILNKHPAIIEFIEILIEKNWIPKSKEINKVIHRIIILEILTSAYVNNVNFAEEIYSHFNTIRSKYGINWRENKFSIIKLIKKFSFFESIKILSIDPAINYYTIKRDQNYKINKRSVEKLLDKHEISFIEKNLLLNKKNKKSNYLGLRLNIYEAGSFEYANNFKDNAFCSNILNEQLIKKKDFEYVEKNQSFPQNKSDEWYEELYNPNNEINILKLDKDWVSLYESWNLGFIIGNLNLLNILVPKLLIPSVIDVNPDHYIQNRLVSLWIISNVYLFKKIKNNKNTSPSKKNQIIANKLGEINKKYAYIYSIQNNFKDDDFEKKYSNRLVEYLKMVKYL